MTTGSTIIDVACAIIIENGKVLVTQRSPMMKMPGKWEFPGGKVEPGETPEQCIQREIKEELNLEIIPGEQLIACTHDHAVFQIRLLPFVVTEFSGKIQLSEHQQFRWMEPSMLPTLDLAPADLQVVTQLKKVLETD